MTSKININTDKTININKVSSDLYDLINHEISNMYNILSTISNIPYSEKIKNNDFDFKLIRHMFQQCSIIHLFYFIYNKL